MGSLSPLHPVASSKTSGFSHVCLKSSISYDYFILQNALQIYLSKYLSKKEKVNREYI